MWNSCGTTIETTKCDFGVSLPITIDDVEFAAGDELQFAVKVKAGGAAVIERTFTDITENAVSLVLTAEEAAALNVGAYVWTLDWYRDGVLQYNLVRLGSFKVVGKG